MDDRRSLGITAIMIIVLMAIVATAGLDNLPRPLRRSVAAAGSHLTADRAAFNQNREFVDRTLRDEPALFQNKAVVWRQHLDKDRSELDAAAATLVTLQQLAKANRRADRDKVQHALAEFDTERQDPVRDVAAIRTEADRWLNYKHQLPSRIEAMRASYDALKAFDLDAATAPVHKAMVDWPDKRADLQTRLDGLKDLQSQGDKIWESTARIRTAAAANTLADSDYSTFFTDADRLDQLARQVKDGAGALNTLAGQLYTSWDKLLADVERDDGYREKLRIVRTRYPDATLTHGETSNEEQWRTIDSAEYRDAERKVGMAIEHKSAGKYDNESERTAQPAAYAYVAPPGQSNAYGSWTGGVWHWLPEYLILSHLLHSSRPAITSGDFDAYQNARRRGEIFYGRNDEYRPRWYGHSDRGGSILGGSTTRPSSPGVESSGGWYKERPKPSWGERSFSGSRYESHGAFSGSRFQSRGSFGSAARSFSRGGAGRMLMRGGRR